MTRQPTPWIITLAFGALTAFQEWMRQGQVLAQETTRLAHEAAQEAARLAHEAAQEAARQTHEAACLESSQEMFGQFIEALKIAQGG